MRRRRRALGLVLCSAAAAVLPGPFYSNTTALPEIDGTVAAIVLSFNHKSNVEPIARHLHNEPGITTVVVAEDGSTDGSLEAWKSVLRGKDRIMQSNDVHEIRAYNGAAKVAQASILCFLQDDDVPDSPGWAAEVSQLFRDHRFQRLAVISGLAAEVCQVEIGEQDVDHPAAMKNTKKARPIPYETQSGVPFMFATEAWLAPLCVRKDAWEKIGGFDETLTLPGEPGIGLDIHLSLRAAAEFGWTVGVHGTTFKRGVRMQRRGRQTWTVTGRTTSREQRLRSWHFYAKASAVAGRRPRLGLRPGQGGAAPPETRGDLAPNPPSRRLPMASVDARARAGTQLGAPAAAERARGHARGRRGPVRRVSPQALPAEAASGQEREKEAGNTQALTIFCACSRACLIQLDCALARGASRLVPRSIADARKTFQACSSEQASLIADILKLGLGNIAALQESSEGPSEGHAPEPPPAAMAPFPAHMVAAAAGGGISAAQLAAVAAAVGFDTVGFDDNESHWSDDDSEAAADSDDVEGVFRVCDAGLEGFRHGDAFAFFISDDAVFNSLSGGDYDVFLDKDSLVSLGIARECGIVRADLDLDLNVNKKMDPKLFHAAALVLDAPLRHDCLFTSPWFDTCCKLLAMLIRFSQFRESLCQCKYVQAAALGRRYLLHCASERDASADDAARSVFRILQALVEDVPGFCVAEEMNEDDQPKAFRALNLASRHALAIASRSPALAEDEGEGSPTDAKANPPRGEAVQFLRSLARHLFMPWPDVDDADAFLEVLLENPPASCSPTLDADGDEEGYVTLDLAVAACLVEFVENAAFDKDDPDNEDDDDVCAFWLRQSPAPNSGNAVAHKAFKPADARRLGRLCDAQHLLPLVHFVMATGAEASKFAFLVKHAGSCAQGKKIIVNCLRAYVPNVDIPSLKGLSAEKIYYKLAGVAETPATSAVAAALQESYERFFREDAAAKAARFIEAKARAAAHQIWLEEQKVVSERVAQELVALEEAEAALHEAKKNVKKSKKKGKHKPKAAAPPAAPETPQQDDSSDDDDYFLGLRGRRASLSQASKGVSALQTAPTSPEVADEWNTVESSRNDRKEKQSKKREEYEREMTDLARAAAKAEAVERKRVADLDAADRAIAASFDFKGFTSGDAKVDGLLAELGLHFLAPAFLEHEIDRDALKLLTVDDYAEIGVDRNIAEMLITGVSRLWAAGGPLQEDGEVPEHFVCPISFDLMRDPVVAADGASYEKQCIEEWLQDNDTSPLTNLPLAHKDLRPNHALKHLIMKRYSRGAASSSGAFSSWSAPSVEKTSRYAAVMRPHTGPGRGVPLVMAAGTPVRSGRIRVWKYQYGFIIPGDGGLDIFFHDKSTLEPGDPPFVPGDRVVYQMATGLHIDGKPPAAVNVKKA